MKRIHIIPNLLTTGNFFCGLLGLTLAMGGKYFYAAEACLVAMLFDFVDGQVARRRGLSTRFGIEFDSLADMLSFGILPASMGYLMVLRGIGRLGLGIAFLYAVCSALRLARYNANVYSEERKSFMGLPTPAAGGLISSLVIFAGHFELDFAIKLLPFVMLALSYLMVSTLRYPALQPAGRRQKKPFLNLVGIVIAASVVASYPEASFLVLFAAYAAIGILTHFRYRTIAHLIRSILLAAPIPDDSEKP